MSNSTDLSTLTSIENLIHSHNTRLENLQKELKTHKMMLDALLENDKEFQEAASGAAAATKLKTQAKAKVLSVTDAKNQVEKIKEQQTEAKELKIALSDYLSQYVILSGSNQIESPDGQVFDIISNAHLTKNNKN
ncbi:MAG: hypothetical protein WC069_02755 [Candidatus Shapirobacteria bacterium]